MATISSLGVGSNLDLSTLLTQLQTAESQPLVDLQNRAASFTSKLSAYGTLQSALGVLKTASDKLSDPALFQGWNVNVGSTGVLTASAASTASAGSYSVNVTQLAQSQSLVTVGQASATTAIGSGTITIDFGTISGGTLDAATGKYTGASFTADASRTAVPITIGSTNNTLQGIRDAINSANAGVTASIVNDGSGTPNRLVLASNQTGEASSMRVSVTGDAALQNLLSNDPAGTQNLQQTLAAQNAKLTVNGIAVTSATNTVSEAVQGVTMNLLSAGTTSLATQPNTSSVQSAVSDFVNAYNKLQSTANTLTAYNASTKTGAVLMGDSTLLALQVRIRQALTTPQAGGTNDMKVLSEIGVSFQKDGTLSLDSTKLGSALATNLAGVSKLFASDSSSTSGYGKQMSALIDNVTATGGLLQAATAGVSTTIKQLGDQYDAMKLRIDDTVARYRTQFTQLDVMVSSMNNTMSYLKQQFAAMSGTSSGA